MFWVAAGSVVIGVAARVVACLDDLWFDEVWSVLIVRDYVHSPLDVFTNFKHSNNNHLNSLWLWLMGYGAWPPLYRVPSLIASVGTIALAGLIGGRPSAGGAAMRDRLGARVAVTIASWSYLLIHFGTEARGYSAVVFFVLLAWYALLRFEDHRAWRWAVVYWLAVVLGFLAHLEFIACCGAIALWSIWRTFRHRVTWAQSVADLLILHAVPAVLSSVFYFVSIRGMKIGTGPAYALTPLLVKTASYTVGGAAGGVLGWTAALAMVGAAVLAIGWLVYQRSDQWLFYLPALATPLLLLAIHRPDQLYPRYFMANVAAYLVLVPRPLAALMRRGPSGLGVGAILLVVFIAGNAVDTASLLRYGRGQYLAALRFMEQQAAGGKLVIASDQDLRNGLLVEYYRDYLEHPGQVAYMGSLTQAKELRERGELAQRPEWFLADRFEIPRGPDSGYRDKFGNRYRLIAVYQYSDLSGWHWLIYHNIDRPLIAPAQPLMR